MIMNLEIDLPASRMGFGTEHKGTIRCIHLCLLHQATNLQSACRKSKTEMVTSSVCRNARLVLIDTKLSNIRLLQNYLMVDFT